MGKYAKLDPGEVEDWTNRAKNRLGSLADLTRPQRAQVYAEFRQELNDEWKGRQLTVSDRARQRLLLEAAIDAIEREQRKQSGRVDRLLGWVADTWKDLTLLGLSLSGVIGAVTDLLKPLAQFTQIMAIGSGAAALIFGIASRRFSSPGKSGSIAVFSGAVCAVCCGFWGFQILVPSGKDKGAISATVPGADLMQEKLFALFGRIESNTRETKEGIGRLEQSTREIKKETSDDPAKELANLGITNKPNGLKDAFRDGNGRIVSLLIQSGYKPSRLELRDALLQIKPTPQLESEINPLIADIKALACSYVEFDRPRPNVMHAVVGAETAHKIMTAMGKNKWRALCSEQKQKWRSAFSAFEDERAFYKLPAEEKQRRVDACLKRYNTKSGLEKWSEINCKTCGQFPRVPPGLDKDDALFMGFNLNDAFGFVTSYDRYSPFGSSVQKEPKNPAEAFCTFQYRVRTEKLPFDELNYNRVKELASILD